jgi:hypothetical protein
LKTSDVLVGNYDVYASIHPLQSSQTNAFNWRVKEPLSKIVYNWV